MRLNPVNLITNIDRYYGKKVKKITDRSGNEHEDLSMVDYIIIHFDDGEQLSIGKDWRGTECYISQYTTD